MECVDGGDGGDTGRDSRLLAEPPATLFSSSQSFPIPRRTRRSVAGSTSIHPPIVTSSNVPRKPPRPTGAQQRALNSLASSDPAEVIAWLKVLRCLASGYQHHGGPAPLTVSELSAASELKDCEEGWLLSWLKSATSAVPTTPARVAQPSAAPETLLLPSTPNPRQVSRAFDQASSRSTHRSSTSFNPSSGFSLRTATSTISDVTSCSQASTIEQESPTASRPGSHLHWCTVCENPKAIKTCDGWKRHMNEHETAYLCMLNGSPTSTETPPRCCFCDAPNPDAKHFTAHKVSECHGEYGKPKSYTRKINFLKHLEGLHGASSACASRLAEEWRNSHMNKRKFFSCGFCICLFSTLTEVNNHIDVEHWSQHQELVEWDNNKVILGLLLRPGVMELWEQWLTSYGIDPDLDTVPQWQPSEVKDIQLRLEVDQGSPAALANLAFRKSSYFSTFQLQRPLSDILEASDEHMEMDGPISGLQTSSSVMPVSKLNAMDHLSNARSNRRPLSSREHDVDAFREANTSFASDLANVQYDQATGTMDSYQGTSCTSQQDMGHDVRNNQLDLLDPQWSNTSNMGSGDTTWAAAPWSSYTSLERQHPAQMYGMNDFRYHVEPDSSAMPLAVTANASCYEPNPSPPADANLTDSFSSTMQDTDPDVYINAPVRRKPHMSGLLIGSKRRLSGSRTGLPCNSETNSAIVVDAGNRSQYHQPDDHLRSRRRIEGYNIYDS